MLDKNNLIIIYGKAGSYKSSLGISLLNVSNKKCCYIDLEGNKHIPVNSNVVVYNDINKIDDYIKENDVILIDYIELVGYKIEDILKLKDKVAATNKSLIIISCCSTNKHLLNDRYNDLRNIASLIITTDK